MVYFGRRCTASPMRIPITQFDEEIREQKKDCTQNADWNAKFQVEKRRPLPVFAPHHNGWNTLDHVPNIPKPIKKHPKPGNPDNESQNVRRFHNYDDLLRVITTQPSRLLEVNRENLNNIRAGTPDAT